MWKAMREAVIRGLAIGLLITCLFFGRVLDTAERMHHDGADGKPSQHQPKEAKQK